MFLPTSSVCSSVLFVEFRAADDASASAPPGLLVFGLDETGGQRGDLIFV